MIFNLGGPSNIDLWDMKPEAPVEVRGPSVCPIARIAGKYRRQIELLSESAAEISRVLAEAR